MLTVNYAVKANTKWNKSFIVRVHWRLFIFLFFLIISLIFHYLSTYSTSAKPTLWHMPVSFFHNRSFFFWSHRPTSNVTHSLHWKPKSRCSMSKPVGSNRCCLYSQEMEKKEKKKKSPLSTGSFHSLGQTCERYISLTLYRRLETVVTKQSQFN